MIKQDLYLKKKGFGKHLAWLPIYLSRDKKSEISKVIIELDKKVTAANLYDRPYFDLQIGVSSGCYYGKTI